MKKNKPLVIKTVGEPNLDHLTEGEQKTFYITMLTRILELRRQQLEEQQKNAPSDNEGGDADAL